MKIHIKRIYDKPVRNDGFRVLVDRLWPRGFSKDAAKIDWWVKDAAPSTALRLWFHEDKVRRRSVFETRYKKELTDSRAAAALKQALLKKSRITLITAVKDIEYSHIPVLINMLHTGPP